MDRNWRTIYQCHKCGNLMSADVGSFGGRFFWDDVCGKCGESKGDWSEGFRNLGVAYQKWQHTWKNWLRFVWVDREGKIY